MNEKKGVFVAGGIVLLVVAVVFVLRVIGGEDAWLCVDGTWIAHGHPSAPMPTSGCGLPVMPAATSTVAFSAMGNLVKDNPGFTPGVWYLVYEKPGNPGMAVQLSLDASSSCTISGRTSSCTGANLVVGDRVTVDGIENGGVVTVTSLVDESSTKLFSSCPEWVNCMPGPDVGTRCVIPPGCEGITQKAY